MKEYGRNIQYLVQHAQKTENPEERATLVQDIIELMGTLNPALRNVEDYRHKLWDHIFMISKFELDVESPYPIPDQESLRRKNMKLEYPRERVHFRHYGKYVEAMIKKAISMEDPEKKAEYTLIIGNYMKLVYQNWNRENVDNEQIRADISFLSQGKLVLEDIANLDSLAKSNRFKQGNSNNPRQSGGRQQNRNYKQGKNRNYKRNR